MNVDFFVKRKPLQVAVVDRVGGDDGGGDCGW